MKKFLLCFLFLAFLPGVQALQIGENLYISLPPETIQCVNILLPDSAGVYTPGLIDYEISSDANWGDLTEQLVTTDENNTVRIPMCFSSFGRDEGDCSNIYSLSIEAPIFSVEKAYGGGVCVSTIPDIDYGEPQEGDTPMDVLNDNADIFDLAFEISTLYAEDGEESTFTLLIQSYADVTIDFTSEGLTPKTKSVKLSTANPKASLEFSTTQQGPVSVTGKIRDCDGSFCSKKTSAEVVVPLQTGIKLAGFSVFLFPASLNIKNLDPVKYELIIKNNGEEKEFDVELVLPEGMDSGFTKQSLTFEGKETIQFEVVPTQASSLYEVVARVTSEGNTKEASASLSSNELLTDATRQAEQIKKENPEAASFVDSELDSWYETYTSTEYGEELGGYAEFKDSMEKAEAPKETPQQNETPPTTLPPPIPQEPEQDYTFIILIVVAVAALVVVWAIFFMRKPKNKKEELPDF